MAEIVGQPVQAMNVVLAQPAPTKFDPPAFTVDCDCCSSIWCPCWVIGETGKLAQQAKGQFYFKLILAIVLFEWALHIAGDVMAQIAAKKHNDEQKKHIDDLLNDLNDLNRDLKHQDVYDDWMMIGYIFQAIFFLSHFAFVYYALQWKRDLGATLAMAPADTDCMEGVCMWFCWCFVLSTTKKSVARKMASQPAAAQV